MKANTLTNKIVVNLEKNVKSGCITFCKGRTETRPFLNHENEIGCLYIYHMRSLYSESYWMHIGVSDM